MVYDGDCGFCRYAVRRLAALTGERVEYRPYQEAAADFPDIGRSRFQEAVHLVEPGTRAHPEARASWGADATLRALEYAGGVPRLLGRLYLKLPGALPLARLVYHWVARNRARLAQITPEEEK